VTNSSARSGRQLTTRTARVFAAGAGLGFLAGGFVASAIVWRYGNVVGSRAANLEHPPATPPAVERFVAGIDDAGDAVIEGTSAPAATTGEPAPVLPPPAGTDPAVETVASNELADRDLIIPVAGIKPEQLLRTFTDRRSGGRAHEAIDILAPMDTPVLAVEGGTIARLFYSKAGGISVYQFDPTERFCFYYAHLARYAEGLREGQTVTKGQILGYVGVSGNAPKQTPHLHFAIFRLTEAKRWWEGTPIDPFDVLK
jgi:murein DD-endopeptidase MepM/ murein hydrolase activator NlpD